MISSFDRRVLPPGLQIGEWRAADGWPLRRFDWAAGVMPPRGSIVFQTGRGDFIEKYLEVYAHLHGQGWHVSGFDWRGQGGSGRMIANGLAGHLPSLDPLLDDLEGFVSEWRQTNPAPHVLIGHSMGGNLILRLLAERKVVVDAAVVTAPMLGLNTGPIPAEAARMFTRLLCMLGLAKRQAWREGDRPTVLGSTRQANLTSCPVRYADESWWKAEHPELALATPTWGWLNAAYASIARLNRPGVLEKVRAPVLMIGASHDRLVSPAAIIGAAARIPDARLIMSEKAAHEPLREADDIRLPLLAEIDRFLDEKAPCP